MLLVQLQSASGFCWNRLFEAAGLLNGGRFAELHQHQNRGRVADGSGNVSLVALDIGLGVLVLAE
jgi:hypothetical protein